MKTRFRRRVYLQLAVITMVLALSSVTIASEKISIIGPMGPSWTEPLKIALASFTAKTGIEVEVQVVASFAAMWDKVATLTASGLAPDVLYCDNTSLGYFALNNMAMPLDSLVATDKLNMAKYNPSVLNSVTLRGKLFSLPTALSIYHMFYNTELFNKSGIAPIPTDWQSKSFTWDEFVQTAKKLAQGNDGTGKPAIGGVDGLGWTGGLGFIGMWNQYIVAADEPIYYGDRPEVIAALEKTTSLWTTLNVVGGDFFQSTAAMTPRQTVYLPRLIKNVEKVSWSVGIMPKGDQRSTHAAFHGLGIGAGSRNPNLAWQLVKYFAYDPEGAVLFSRAENRLPVMRETAVDFIKRYSGSLPLDKLMAMTDAAAYSYDHRLFRHKRGQEISSTNGVGGALSRVTKGEKSVEQAMTEIAPTIRAYLAED